jgi:hypothetical protein
VSDFDPRNLVAWLAVAVCLAFALVLRRTGERGSSARKLALLLVVEAGTLATSGAVGFGIDTARLFDATGEPKLEFRLTTFLHHACDAALIALYLPFLASALTTPLARKLGTPAVRLALAGIAIAEYAGLAVDYLRFVPVLYASLGASFLFALFASLHALRGAPPGLARARALAFVTGFGLRDLAWAGFYGWFAVLAARGDVWGEVPNWYLIYPLGSLLSVPLIAYGILKTHLFDIDLRVKWTLQRSTLAAAFVAIVYLVSEGADRFFSAELGSAAGLLIGAGVVFFLAPLQRFAERVANAAMPSTQDTPAYAAFKKLQVYEAALAEALAGGGVSERERAMLARLRESLGIAAADAEALERDLAARSALVTGTRNAS